MPLVLQFSMDFNGLSVTLPDLTYTSMDHRINLPSPKKYGSNVSSSIVLGKTYCKANKIMSSRLYTKNQVCKVLIVGPA